MVDINPIKRKFFVACNSILGKAKCLNDIIKLSLMESYCLPILSYATVAMKLTHAQICDLNACWNSVYRRIFGFNKWESVRVFIHDMGRLDFCHLRDQAYLRLKFVSCGMVSKNVLYAYMYVMKRLFFSDVFKEICCDTGLRVSSHKQFISIPCGVFKKAVHLTFADTCAIYMQVSNILPMTVLLFALFTYSGVWLYSALCKLKIIINSRWQDH